MEETMTVLMVNMAKESGTVFSLRREDRDLDGSAAEGDGAAAEAVVLGGAEAVASK
uniref:Uncharacterized protein n=1 Tax=Trifolium medium TaxID=97028 RepID=A0A392MGA9_9FABA